METVPLCTQELLNRLKGQVAYKSYNCPICPFSDLTDLIERGLRGCLNSIRYSSPTPSGPLHMTRVIALQKRVNKSTTYQVSLASLFFIPVSINNARNAS